MELPLIEAQLLVLNNSINVLPVVKLDGLEVRLTVIVTKVEFAGTVKRYHTSARLPQPPVGLVVLARYRSPFMLEQFPFTVNTVAVAQVLLAACPFALFIKHAINDDVRRVNTNAREIKPEIPESCRKHTDPGRVNKPAIIE
jgi:hypothetical protein